MKDTLDEKKKIKTFRYKFNDYILKEIKSFAKIHQYDDRKTFKDAWKDWLETNRELVNNETERLNNLNYNGNIEDKLFRSTRYYFRNKLVKKNSISDIDDISKKLARTYINIDIDILSTIDKHIEININTENYSPADGYKNYIIENKDILKNEYNRLQEENENFNFEIFTNKIKKTYKNRYFIYTKS